MVLSRFWLVIFISSIIFIVVSLFTANSYSIDFVLNGEKGDPILISEKYIDQLPAFIKDSIENAPDKTMVINNITSNPDTTYVYSAKTVKIYSDVQKADGLLPTCKYTLVDLILPLIAYLAFFCCFEPRICKSISKHSQKSSFYIVHDLEFCCQLSRIRFGCNTFWTKSHGKFTRTQSRKRQSK